MSRIILTEIPGGKVKKIKRQLPACNQKSWPDAERDRNGEMNTRLNKKYIYISAYYIFTNLWHKRLELRMAGIWTENDLSLQY